MTQIHQLTVDLGLDILLIGVHINWPSCITRHTLQWLHNERDGVSNRQPHDCSLNRLFGKHQSSVSLAFVRGIHRSPVNSSHKGPVTRIMFPFDDVIMEGQLDARRVSVTAAWMTLVNYVPNPRHPGVGWGEFSSSIVACCQFSLLF